jgi:hypothetical protein
MKAGNKSSVGNATELIGSLPGLKSETWGTHGSSMN